MLYPRIQRIVDEFETLEKELNEMKSNIQTVRIGFCHGTHLLFMEQMHEFRQKHPNIHLEVLHCQTEEALSELKKERVDFVISGCVVSDDALERHPAYRCQALWGVQNDSPMGKRGYITDDEVHSIPICLSQSGHNLTFPNCKIRSEVRQSRSFARLEVPDNGRPFASVIMDDDMFYLCKLVLQGKAIMPISEKLIPSKIEGISFVPCPEHPYYWEVHSYCFKNHHLKKGARQLLQEVFTVPTEEPALNAPPHHSSQISDMRSETENIKLNHDFNTKKVC
jgi:DNA-binding transcriptional LysR family regulator